MNIHRTKRSNKKKQVKKCDGPVGQLFQAAQQTDPPENSAQLWAVGAKSWLNHAASEGAGRRVNNTQLVCLSPTVS